MSKSFNDFERTSQAQKVKRLYLILDNQHDLDSVINFKVNSHLKAEFDRICKEEHSNLSRELKVFMLNVVKQGHL